MPGIRVLVARILAAPFVVVGYTLAGLAVICSWFASGILGEKWPEGGGV